MGGAQRPHPRRCTFLPLFRLLGLTRASESSLFPKREWAVHRRWIKEGHDDDVLWEDIVDCHAGEPDISGAYSYTAISRRVPLNVNIQVHAESFVAPTYSRFRTNPLFQYVQVNLQENILKSFLVRMFSNSLRSTVPKELHSTYLVSSQNMEYVHDPLGMTNSKVGYVYLVDENLKIRWAGCADAYPNEAPALESCTGVILKRLEEKA